MQARTHSLLALALGAALLSPMAMAQGGKSAIKSVGGKLDSTMQAVPAPRATDVAKSLRDAMPPAPVDKTGIDASARARVDGRVTAADKGIDTDVDAGVTSELDATTDLGSRAAAPSRVARDAAFGVLDNDRDGIISSVEAEADATFQGRFGSIDTDGDGSVSADEYKVYSKTQVPPAPPANAQGAAHAAGHSSVVQRSTFATLDADADGRISAAEAEADADFSAAFASMDANGDGAVTDAEFRAKAKATSGRTP
jgi:Ca2+-binding EF-hand superfamily protein